MAITMPFAHQNKRYYWCGFFFIHLVIRLLVSIFRAFVLILR